jgi:hypothetical protein
MDTLLSSTGRRIEKNWIFFFNWIQMIRGEANFNNLNAICHYYGLITFLDGSCKRKSCMSGWCQWRVNDVLASFIECSSSAETEFREKRKEKEWRWTMRTTDQKENEKQHKRNNTNKQAILWTTFFTHHSLWNLSRTRIDTDPGNRTYCIQV